MQRLASNDRLFVQIGQYYCLLVQFPHLCKVCIA